MITGINIGSLIQYPVCFLQDVEKYRFYIGRGCRAGRELLTINADGKTQACVHEKVGYGNILKDGLKECWKNMRMWRNGSLIPPTCSKCEWLPDCEGACRVYTDDLKSMDSLACDPSLLPSRANYLSSLVEIASQTELFVPGRVRWRQEDGFQLVNVRGATTYAISNSIADYLKKHQTKQTSFTAEDFPGSVEDVADLMEKWVVEQQMVPRKNRALRCKSASLVESR